MRLGFTGTRLGMTERQQSLLREKLLELNPGEIHHGDCIGADAQCHAIAEELGIRVIVHPPAEDKYRAYCKSPYVMLTETYLIRNRNIVCSCDMLIGCPANSQAWSGTRYTIRYAETMGKSTIVILP